MEDGQLLAALIFAESTKKNMKDFEADGTAIGHVARNRAMRPERFGNPGDGFSSVGGDEFNKFISGNLTEEEEEYAKKALQISNGIIRGKIADPTGGADHMYNPKLDADNDWNVLTDENKVSVGNMYYPETYKSKAHSFRKETLRRRTKKK